MPFQWSTQRLSFEWSHLRISPTDSEIRSTMHNTIHSTTGKYCLLNSFHLNWILSNSWATFSSFHLNVTDDSTVKALDGLRNVACEQALCFIFALFSHYGACSQAIRNVEQYLHVYSVVQFGWFSSYKIQSVTIQSMYTCDAVYYCMRAEFVWIKTFKSVPIQSIKITFIMTHLQLVIISASFLS